MRTQIALDAQQHARAKRKAADLGITLAEYIRRLVDRDLSGAEPESDPSAIFAIGDSGGSDIAREGKGAVGEAVSAATSVDPRTPTAASGLETPNT